MSFVQLLDTYGRYMVLKICVSDDLKEVYSKAVETHNQKITDYVDAGFDLFVPASQTMKLGSVNKVDFGVQCSAHIKTDNGKMYNTGYYMYPRSSLSKTKLRLANSVGIIDAGYRGNLIGMFDALDEYNVGQYDKLLQICAPGLLPIVVEIVDDLGEQTQRGAGGFGSTGR
jgi:dUTP pyrophosphatase